MPVHWELEKVQPHPAAPGMWLLATPSPVGSREGLLYNPWLWDSVCWSQSPASPTSFPWDMEKVPTISHSSRNTVISASNSSTTCAHPLGAMEDLLSSPQHWDSHYQCKKSHFPPCLSCGSWGRFRPCSELQGMTTSAPNLAPSALASQE
jgi:hypothetical protein